MDGVAGLRELESFANQRWLSGFSWAVGREYSDALRMCAFQEGDIVYATRRAYEQWDGVWNSGPFFQVSRSDGNVSTGTFESNWSKRVIVAFYNGATEKQYIETTQGSIYLILATGLIDFLRARGAKPMTGLGKHVRNALKKAPTSPGQFLVPFDSVNWRSYWKVRAICRFLNVPLELKSLSEIVAIPRARPTLMIAKFQCGGLSRAQVTDSVKAALNPSAKSFNLNIHGHYA